VPLAFLDVAAPTVGMVVRDVTRLKEAGTWTHGRGAVQAMAREIDDALDVVVAELARAAHADASLQRALDRARAARAAATYLRVAVDDGSRHA
jgi:hypothetical protein